MPTSHSLSTQANRLYSDIHTVMAQIHAAERGSRLEREQFLALVAQKATIVQEAKTIIADVSNILDLAYNNPSERVPHNEYLTLTSARKMARMVIKIARTAHSSQSQYSQIPYSTTPSSRVNFFGTIDCTKDENLPF